VPSGRTNVRDSAPIGRWPRNGAGLPRSKRLSKNRELLHHNGANALRAATQLHWYAYAHDQGASEFGRY
jgi:hypothetical protein